MKVMTIAGTRPEWIRQSRIISMLDKATEHVIVHSGQNYDYELSEIFFKELKIRRPDHFLEAAGISSSKTIANVISAADEVIADARPDAVVVLGDTDSCFAAVAARKRRVPVYHIEAGNRCFDLNVPEETNRRLIDHLADFNLCYSEHARRNLLAEGLEPRRIFLIGSPMREVLKHYRDSISASNALDDLGLEPREFFLASFHRAESVDCEGALRMIIEALSALSAAHEMPVLITTHPRTRSRLGGLEAAHSSRLIFKKPFGFADYVCLQQQSKCVLSDSGTIAEEAAILGFPAVTIRNAMERPEALEAGNVMISGIDSQAIRDCVEYVIQRHDDAGSPPPPPDYLIENSAERVVKIVLGTARLNARWHGFDG